MDSKLIAETLELAAFEVSEKEDAPPGLADGLIQAAKAIHSLHSQAEPVKCDPCSREFPADSRNAAYIEIYDQCEYCQRFDGYFPPQPPKAQEAEPVAAEEKLAKAGVFKGIEGLRGLAEADDFWEEQMYGTRLCYGPGIADYLHRGVLRTAVELLDSPQPAKAQMNPAECDPEVYRDGEVVTVLDMPKEDAEAFCREQTELSRRKYDWHYFGGRVVIKTQPTKVQIPEGWKLVPVKSTREMNQAADMTSDPWTVWEQMAAASPKSPTHAEQEWVLADEKFPTIQDADVNGKVWRWHPVEGIKYRSPGEVFHRFHKWAPTGLVKPAPPKEGA